MKIIGIIGVFGVGPNFTTGQAVKCYTIMDWLQNRFGTENIYIVNTYQWKKCPFRLYMLLHLALKKCRNIVIMPAQHGVKVIVPLVYFLNKIFHRGIYYIVIGGWLAKMLQEKPLLKKYIEYYDGIYVETLSMKKELEMMGLSNVRYLPNSREYIPHKEHYINQELPLHICTYSRVVKEKGIIDAIQICRLANSKSKNIIFYLDIYGSVALDFKKNFEEVLKKNEDIVSYKGCKSADESIETISKYFALLFPSYYEGEGFAGTILEGFVAGVPVIANDWKYNSEIVLHKINGLIYPFRDLDVASNLLLELYQNRDLYNTIRRGCRNSAEQYSTSRVMSKFVVDLK